MALTQKDVIYFIMTDRFYGLPNPNPKIKELVNKSDPYYYHGGNFDGIIEKIPYLKKLGVTAVWITPVYLQLHLDGVKGYHGYWAYDFDSIDPTLYVEKSNYKDGSKQYLKDLVDKLHEHDLKLVLDMVVNHVGYGHPGVNNSEPNSTPIRQHWFHSKDISLHQSEIEGRLAGLPDFDLDSPDVCDYHINSILKWIEETGIDAIRMDTVKHVEAGFWNYFKTQIKGKYPNVSLVGEVFVFDIERISEYQKYWAFDSLFDFPMQNAIKQVFIEDNSMETFYSSFDKGYGILEKDKTYTNHNKLVTLLDNHDLSARYMTFAMWKHNNSREISAMVMKLSLTFMFTSRGIPQIYYGTEIGMEGGHDPDNRRDFRWDIFDDQYDVKTEYGLEKQIFDHTVQLIKIRKENDALTCGNLISLYVDHFLFVYLRYVADNIVITAIFNGWEEMSKHLEVDIINNANIPLRVKRILKNAFLKCALTDEEIVMISGKFSLKMKGKSAMILKIRE